MRPFGDIQLRGEIFGIAGKDIILIPEAGQNVDVSSTRIVNVADPVNPQDALTLNYFDNNQLTVGAGSANYLTISGGEINISALAITDVTVDSTSADLATFISTGYTGGNELQEGDTLILTVPGEAYIHNGGSAGTAADFTLIETPGITDSAVRALFSGGNGIDYNAGSGVISVDLGANGGLGFDGGNALVINGLANYTAPTGTNIAIGYDGSNNLVLDSAVITAALSPITASNGLTKVVDDIQLGGSLSSSTSIDTGSNVLSIVDGLNTFAEFSTSGGQVGYEFSNGAEYARLTFGGFGSTLETSFAGQEASINVNNGTITVAGSGSFVGAVYDADYSGNFVDESLITKRYVDDAIAAIPAGDLQSVLDAGDSATSTMSVNTGAAGTGSVRLDINSGNITLRGDTTTLNTYAQTEVTNGEIFFSRINASAANKTAKYGDAYFEYLSPVVAEFSANTLVHKQYVDDAIAAASSTYRETFADGGLTAGEITITHNLGEQYVQVMVVNEANKAITPDDITFDSSNALTLDLSSFTGFVGNFQVVVTA